MPYKCEYCNKIIPSLDKRKFCTKTCENKSWVEANRVSLSGLSPAQREAVRSLVATFRDAQSNVSVSGQAVR